MSPYIADEVSTRIDRSAFTTVGIMMPPRDPDEEDEDDENEARGRSGAGRRLRGRAWMSPFWHVAACEVASTNIR